MAFTVYLGAGDGAATDSINLANTDAISVRETTFTAPPAESEGDLRNVSMKLRIKSSTADGVWALYRTIEEKLRQARDAAPATGIGSKVALSVKWGGTAYTYFDVVDGKLTIDPENLQEPYHRGAFWILPAVTLELQCLPYLRADQITVENYCLQSENVSATWVGVNTTLGANTTTAPDGAATGDRVARTAVGLVTFGQTISSLTALTNYTFSWYGKANTSTLLGYAIWDNTNSAFIVAETDYVASINTATWTRLQVAFTTPASCTSVIVYPVYNSRGGNTSTYIWGMQLNAGAYAGPYVATTTTAWTAITYTNGTGSTVLFRDTPGDVPALAQWKFKDVSTGGGVVNAILCGQQTAANLNTGDYVGIHDMSAAGSGFTGSDATAVGSAYQSANSISAMQTIASVTKPSAAWARGLMDHYLRVRDSAAYLVTPGTPAGYNWASASSGGGYPLWWRQRVVGAFTAAGSVTLNFGQTALRGNSIVVMCITSNTTATQTPSGGPGGWTTLTQATGTGCAAQIHYVNAIASATNTAAVITFGSSSTGVAVLLEVAGTAYSSAFGSVVNATATAVTSVGNAITPPFAFGVVIGCAASTGSGAHTMSASLGITPLEFYDNATTADFWYQNTTVVTARTITTTGTSGNWAQSCVHIKSFVQTAVSASATANVPCAVTLLDASGNESAVSQQVTVNFGTNRGVYVVWDESPSTGQKYRVYLYGVGTWRYWETGTVQSPNIMIPNVTTGATGTASPPTAQSVDPSRWRVRVGLSSGTTTFEGDEFPSKIANNTWELLYTGTGPLSPIPAAEDGTMPDWIVYGEGRNGTSTTSLDVDFYMALPHNGFTFYAEYRNFVLATSRDWIIEINRYLRKYSYLVQTGTSTEAGQPKLRGNPHLANGDSQVLWHLFGASGASDVVNLKVNLNLKITPRFRNFTGQVT